jgi:hypothetical protein
MVRAGLNSFPVFVIEDFKSQRNRALAALLVQLLPACAGIMFSHVFLFTLIKEVRLVTSRVPIRMKFAKVAHSGLLAT